MGTDQCVRSACCFAGVMLAACGLAHGQTLIVRSGFDTSNEGWLIRTKSSTNRCTFGALNNLTEAWVATGGNPGGFVRHVDPRENRTAYWMVPGGYLGNQSAAVGGVLRFDLQQSLVDAQFDDLDIVMQGGGLTLVFDTAYHPGATWTGFEVPLRAGTGWRVTTCDGAFATPAQVQQAMGNLLSLFIRGEFREGADTDGIDNVEVWGPAPVEPALVSTFDADIERWWVVDDAAVVWDATGGNPGGAMRADEPGSGGSMQILAASKFTGDRSGLYGSTMKLDVKASAASDEFSTEGMLFLGNGSIEIAYVAPGQVAGNAWRTHVVPLTASPAWVRVSDGMQATQTEFVAVLANLSRVKIRGEYRTGAESTWVDNVSMGECAPSAYAWSSALVACPTATVTMQVAAGGSVNGLTFRWLRNGQELNDGEGVAGAMTANLTLSGLNTGFSGTYDCIVTNSCGAAASNPLALTVCESDFNCDSVSDFFDYLDFVAAFSANDPEADFNHDEVIDFFDYLDFVAAFSAGC